MANISGSSEATSFEIGGRSTKPKSSTVGGQRPSNRPDSGADALMKKEFAASLVASNQQAESQQPDSTSDKDTSHVMNDLQKF